MNEQQDNTNGNDLPFQAQVKLPRNIRHWATSRGLVINGDYFKDGSLYMHSERLEFTRGILDSRRHFRILGHLNYFQICDGDFDRWANSVGKILPIPMKRDDFDATLDKLVATAETRELTEERINEDADRHIRWALNEIERLHDRFGDVVAWANANGRHGKWVRGWVHRYQSGLVEQRRRIRQANRHRKAKLDELAAQQGA